jgi:hypothetical protein
MKLFRHPGLIIAIFWCAAMVLAPMVAGQRMDQMAPGQASGPGGSVNQIPGNGQNNAAPGQPDGMGNATAPHDPQDRGSGNMTAFGNRTMHTPSDGNMTAPPDMPDWSGDNSTAMGNMTMHRPDFANETAHPMPPDGNRDNSTAVLNQSWHGPAAGNHSLPVPPLQESGQSLDEQLSAGTIIDELISWLRARTGT